MYETGGRIGELLNLRRKHVQFDNIGAVLIFSGKTGDRRVRLITTTPALSQWMLDHPLDDPDAPLWVTLGDRNRGAPLDYGAARYALQSLAERAKIKKRINPHSFRHARASYLANHLTEAQLGKYLGWTHNQTLNMYTALYADFSSKMGVELYFLVPSPAPNG